MRNYLLGGLVVMGLGIWPFVKADEQADTDQFINAYALISSADDVLNDLWKQADPAKKTGLTADANQRFTQALQILEKLQTSSPHWQPTIVAYRVKYCQDKLADLKPKLEGIKLPEGTTPPPPVVVLPPLPPSTNKTTNLLEQITAAVNQLQAEVQTKNQQIDLLSKQLTLAQTANQDLAAKFNQAEQKGAERARADLEKIRAENSTLQAEVTALRKAQTELATQLKTSEHTSTASAQESALLRDELAKERNSRVSIEKQLTQLQVSLKEIAALNKTLQTERDKTHQANAIVVIPPTPETVKITPAPAPPTNEDQVRRLEEQLKEMKQVLSKQEALLTLRAQSPDKTLATDRGLRFHTARTNPQRQQEQIAQLRLQIANLEAELALHRTQEVPLNEAERAALAKPEPVRPTNLVAVAPPAVRTKPKTLTLQNKLSSASLPPELASLDEEARALFAEQKLDAAAKKYDLLLQRAPDSSLALTNLAIIRLQQNRSDDAQILLEKNERISPEDAGTHALLGILHTREKRYDEAVGELARALVLEPQNAAAHYHLGIAYTQRQHLWSAEQEFRRALELEPEMADAHYNLAVVYLKITPPQTKLARLHYDKAIELGLPHSPAMEEIVGIKVVAEETKKNNP